MLVSYVGVFDLWVCFGTICGGGINTREKLVGLCPGIASVGPAGRRIAVARTGLVGRAGGQGAFFSFEALDPRGSRVLLSPRADRSPPWAGPLSFFPGQSLGGSFPQGGGWDCLPWPARCRPTVQSHTANPSTVTNFPPWPTAVRSDGAMGRGGHLLTCHSIRVLWAAGNVLSESPE